MGYAAKARGISTVAMGADSEANGDHAVAMGHNAIASGESSIAINNITRALGPNTFAAGNHTLTGSPESFAVGSYNDPIVQDIIRSQDDPLFIVGNGDNETDRRNALVVRRDGKMKIGNGGTYMRNLKGGTYTAGPDNGENDIRFDVDGFALYRIRFDEPFEGIPHITVTARHPDSAVANFFPDTFNTTIQSVTRTEFIVNVQRMDQEVSWGMDLQLTWWGFEL